MAFNQPSYRIFPGIKIYPFYGPWQPFTRWTNQDGTGGWIWGYWGIHIRSMHWLIKLFDWKDGL